MLYEMLHMGFITRLYFYGTERIYEPGTQVVVGVMRPDRHPLPRSICLLYKGKNTTLVNCSNGNFT